MTKPSPSATPAPVPPPAPQSPAGAGVAVPSFPQFIARHELRDEQTPRVFFNCGACLRIDIIDDPTGLCVACWRPFVMLGEALRAMRDEIRAEVTREKETG